MIDDSSRAAVIEPPAAQPDFRSEVLAGLSVSPRTLPCKFFYDQRGAALFQQICDLPEYYITRTELQILQRHGAEMAAALGENIELIGLGTGAGTKTRILLEQLKAPAVYVPVDISSGQLSQSTALFRQLFPDLEILPVCTDYLQPFELPVPSRHPARNVVYFPGSTLGNFEPAIALNFLHRIAQMCGPGGGLLIGVDLRKDQSVLERAYNDSQGVTADFNLNLLVRANRELGANFDLSSWKHQAIYHSGHGRIEMHLISEKEQIVQIDGREFHFEKGERIITEFSYKHTPEGFTALAGKAGFEFEKLWTDEAQLFGDFYFTLPGR